MVLSLLNLQQDESDSVPHFKAAIDQRIQSMALIHEMLYESDQFDTIDLGDYSRRLLNTATSSANAGVSVAVTADRILCPLDKAIPIGLILSELVTNAFKYAFKDRRSGSLDVRVLRYAGNVNVTVSDDGPGLPESFGGPDHSGLGLHLVRALSSQLTGSFSWNTGPGATFTIQFPCPPEATAVE